MIDLATLGLAGGLLSLLVLTHFVVDWVFQDHKVAMTKHNNPKVRAKHCLIYTVGFIPLLVLMHLSGLQLFLSLNILFWSHFAEDTYLPVFWWAKYIRKPPCMDNDAKEGFLQFIDTTLGKILMITIDQIIHIVFLMPIVLMAILK